MLSDMITTMETLESADINISTNATNTFELGGGRASDEPELLIFMLEMTEGSYLDIGIRLDIHIHIDIHIDFDIMQTFWPSDPFKKLLSSITPTTGHEIISILAIA